MGKYTKGYIELKIKQCNQLITGVTSENQKEIYQDYLDFWISKLEAMDLNNLIDPEDDWEVSEAANFKVKFPNKNAYYKRDGIVHKTKAFTEFLQSK